MPKEILILAGGGGHTGYGYALAQRFYGRASLRFLVPEEDALSQRRLGRFGAVDRLLKPRGARTSNYRFVPRLAKSFVESLNRVSRQCDAVISTGSNFCIPPALVAWAKGVPVINIESSVRFTKASKTALVLQRFSAITALQWDEQKKLLKEGVVVGPLLPEPEVTPRNRGYVLVTGGTFGHELLFDAISESSLKNVVLQTGNVDSKQYRKKHPEWKILPFSTKFHEIIAGAELVVTHFGSTVLEAVVYRKPMVIVLNPEWKRTVGKTDAEILAEKVNAVFVWDITLENLLRAMEEARKRKFPVLEDGAQKLVDLVLKL